MEREGGSKRRRSLGFRAESQPTGRHRGRSFADWNIGMFQMRLRRGFDRPKFTKALQVARAAGLGPTVVTGVARCGMRASAMARRCETRPS
jgi:hypothetical protein